jgi:hypothetical protein
VFRIRRGCFHATGREAQANSRRIDRAGSDIGLMGRAREIKYAH